MKNIQVGNIIRGRNNVDVSMSISVELDNGKVVTVEINFSEILISPKIGAALTVYNAIKKICDDEGKTKVQNEGKVQ